MSSIGRHRSDVLIIPVDPIRVEVQRNRTDVTRRCPTLTRDPTTLPVGFFTRKVSQVTPYSWHRGETGTVIGVKSPSSPLLTPYKRRWKQWEKTSPLPKEEGRQYRRTPSRTVRGTYFPRASKVKPFLPRYSTPKVQNRGKNLNYFPLPFKREFHRIKNTVQVNLIS